MLLSVARFNFKSPDLAAEERHYLERHVPLARALSGVRFYYTGLLVDARDQGLAHRRAAILGFDSPDARAAAMRTPTGTDLTADTQAHLGDLVRQSADAEVIVPFDARRPGQSAFVMVATFDLAVEPGGPEASEHRYRDRHVALARQLPRLRHYVIGRLVPGSEPPGYRVALLTFDSCDALREAYRSRVGRELRADEKATIVAARVAWLEARVEI